MMKRVCLTIVFVAMAVAGYAQKVKPVAYGGAVKVMEVMNKNDKVFKVRAIGYGKNDAAAREDAEVRVIRMVLYTGAGKDFPALLRQETDALDDFFDSKQYKDYLGEVTSAGGLVKEKGLKVKKKPFDIVVNGAELDKYLRTNGYKKFGF